MNDLAYKVRARRKELKMSQDELAEKIGYKGRQSINKIEQGRQDIPMDKILVFADALHCSVNYLLSCGSGLSEMVCSRYWNVQFTEEEIERIKTFIDFVIQQRNK